MGDAAIHEHSAGLLTRLGTAVKAMFASASFEPDRLLPSTGTPVPRRHQDALAVLTAARGVVQRGWVKNAWYVMRAPDGHQRTLAPGCLVRVDHTEVVQACLVGAVLHAAWQQSSRPEHANPAIDALWHTLYDGDGPPVGPAGPPSSTAARARDLSTWNDRPHRTRDDVLGLLDRTAARIAGSHG
jgi:hypothetical protein